VAKVLQDIWDDTLTIIQGSLPKERFNLWFQNTELLDDGTDAVRVGVPNAFIGQWLQEHFHDTVRTALKTAMGREVSVRFVVSPQLYHRTREAELQQKQELVEAIGQDVSSRRDPATKADQRYRLDDFVVGHSNRLAYAAAMHVATNADGTLNPLFVHGSVGVGKTHLLRGICREWNRSGTRRALYLGGEDFTNQFLASLQHQSIDGFRRKFRDIDLLALDDVQFLADKPATQDEFLQTYNLLRNLGKQVVLASDSHPRDIDKLRQTLSTRLMSGMIVRVDPPEYETRLAILHRKLGRRASLVGDPVLGYLAEHLAASVRELEGAATTLVATASLTGETVDLQTARRVVGSLTSGRGTSRDVRGIEAAVAEAFFVKVEDLHSKRRHKSIALPRHVAIYLTRELTSMSWHEIGRHFGRRNHTSAIFAHRKIQQTLETDDDLRERIRRLRERLEG